MILWIPPTTPRPPSHPQGEKGAPPPGLLRDDLRSVEMVDWITPLSLNPSPTPRWARDNPLDHPPLPRSLSHPPGGRGTIHWITPLSLDPSPTLQVGEGQSTGSPPSPSIPLPPSRWARDAPSRLLTGAVGSCPLPVFSETGFDVEVTVSPLSGLLPPTPVTATSSPRKLSGRRGCRRHSVRLAGAASPDGQCRGERCGWGAVRGVSGGGRHGPRPRGRSRGSRARRGPCRGAR